MNIKGYELEKDWKTNSASMTTTATKGGKRYFLKKYRNLVCPKKSPDISEKLYQNNKKKFDDFVALRTYINEEIKKFAASGGDIVIPVDQFLDEEESCITYVEASEFIEGEIVKDENVVDVLKSLSLNEKKMLLITATNALRTVHQHNIIHSDLKLTNVMLVKSHGTYNAKIIDFDSSYKVGQVPEIVTGDIKFFSPELGTLSMNEECEDDDFIATCRANMTTKSDIFSLGIILHYYLTGNPPSYTGLDPKYVKVIETAGPGTAYLWAALLCEAKLKIDESIDPLYKKLIRAMLRVNKDERPDTDQIFKALKLGKFDDPYDKGEAEEVKKEEPVEPKKEEIKVDKPVEPEKPKKVDPKVAITREAKFEEPWPEHNIVYNEDKMRSRGYIGLVREEIGATKGYGLFTDVHQEYTTFRNVNTMISLGFASIKPKDNTDIPFTVCEPWPEHNIEFDVDMIKSKGWVSVTRDVSTGTKAYRFTPSVGSPRIINVNNCILLKLAKRK